MEGDIRRLMASDLRSAELAVSVHRLYDTSDFISVFQQQQMAKQSVGRGRLA